MGDIDRYRCELALQRLDDYLDRELSGEEMQSVQEHLEYCVRCAALFAAEAHLLREVRSRLQRVAVPAALRDRLLHALNQVEARS